MLEGNIKIHHKSVEWEAWAGLIWLKIGTGDGMLWMRYDTSGVHKMESISWLVEEQLDCQEGICAIDLFIWLFGWLFS